MRRLAGSPIVDIRTVRGTKAAASYAAKYIGKAPARFGTSRAYWYTRNWSLSPIAEVREESLQRLWFSVRLHTWAETRYEVEHLRPIIDVTTDGWFSIQPHAGVFAPVVFTGRFPPIQPQAPPHE